MRVSVITFFVILLTACTVARAESPSAELAKLFPERTADFQRAKQPEVTSEALGGQSNSSATAIYIAPTAQRLRVTLSYLAQDGDAYSRLTVEARRAQDREPSAEIGSQVGTASFISSDGIVFFKGRCFVQIVIESGKADSQSLLEFARGFAEKLDKGEGDVPVLVKHLPAWEEAQKKVLYLPRFDKAFAGDPALDAIATERDADAVIAYYDSSKLMIVEYHTPQLAADNDQRIVAKIHELWKLGQPAPSAYRRVGNYSVFVFGAPDEQTAKQLIDQIKYEQVVQWLGENPYLFKEAQRRYTETTLGVFVAVVKASGLALIGCLATGGLFGALLFSRRRSQQQSDEAFSDAGGMLRLNIDELTPQTNPARLLRERN